MRIAHVDIDGRSLAVGRIPPPASEAALAPLVFLHEGLGAITMWKNVPQDIADATGRDVIVYDRFGHGQSAPATGSRDFGHEALHVLPRLLEILGIENPVLFGHSDGATIALLHASRHPVRAVVSLAAHVMNEEAVLAGVRAAERAWKSGDLPRRLSRHHGTHAERTFRAWADMWLDPAFRDWSIVETLPSVTAPVLVVQGTEDAYGSLAQVDAIMNGLRPGLGERLILPGCGHMPHLEAWEAVQSATLDFLARRATGR